MLRIGESKGYFRACVVYKSYRVLATAQISEENHSTVAKIIEVCNCHAVNVHTADTSVVEIGNYFGNGVVNPVGRVGESNSVAR